MSDSDKAKLAKETLNGIGKLPFEGRRQMSEAQKRAREVADKTREFRLQFLRNLKPGHPLYRSTEARQARGESLE